MSEDDAQALHRGSGSSMYTRIARRKSRKRPWPTAWDREAFTVLYQLFQMTVTDVSVTGVPITISK